jgi:predicted RNA-binding Zn-ribbon protein involved in translation (DUF1610 family)
MPCEHRLEEIDGQWGCTKCGSEMVGAWRNSSSWTADDYCEHLWSKIEATHRCDKCGAEE